MAANSGALDPGKGGGGGFGQSLRDFSKHKQMYIYCTVVKIRNKMVDELSEDEKITTQFWII